MPGYPGSGGIVRATSAARWAAAATAAGSRSWTVAVPTRLPSTTRRSRTDTSSRQVDWWMRLEAKRVRPPASRMTSASASSAPSAAMAASATSSSRSPSLAMRPPGPPDPHVHAAEAPGGGAVRDPAVLERLALAAVGDPPHHPRLGPADGVQRPPELGGAAVVGGVPVEPAEAAVVDLPGRLHPELEVDPPIVDRPGAVDRQQQPLVGVGHQVVQAALAGLQVDVGHADQRRVGPAVGAHGAARGGA